MKILLVLSSAQVAGWGTQGPNANFEQNFTPHGINSIGTMLVHHDHEVTPLDFRACKNWSEVIQVLTSNKWDRILIGCLSAEYNNALQFIKYAKEYCPNTPIIFGGIHVTVSDTREIEGVTTILHGEADNEILNAIENLPPLIKCKPIQDLDSLPVERRDLFSPYESVTKFLPLLDTPFSSFLFGRGCPYGISRKNPETGKTEVCGYCYRSGLDPVLNKQRSRSPENCIDEIIAEDTRLGGLRSFMCHDDLFILSRTWVERFILNWDTRIGKRIRFWAQFRSDQIIRFRDLMPDLARIGLTWISLGAESFNQDTLDFIGKGCTVEENFEAVEICKENKINLFLNIIKGLPNENAESVKATTDALKKIKPAYFALATYTDLPGTIMNKYCKDNNLILDEHYSLVRYPYEPKIKGVDYSGELHQLWMSVLSHAGQPQNWEDFH